MPALTPQRLSAYLSLILVGLAVALRGGKWERWGYLAILTDNFGSQLLQSRSSWLDPQYAVFVLDCAFLSAMAAMAMFTGRLWPICVAGFQAITVSTYAVFWFSPGSVYRAFYYLNSVLAYLVEGALMGGCLVEGPPLLRRRRAPAG